MDFRIFAFLFGFFCSGQASDFRCHCNEPSCVRTFYLCKSELGCYKLHNSKLVSGGSKVKRSLKYGCIEHLPEDFSYRCWSDNVFDLLKNPNKIRIVSEDKVNEDVVTVTSLKKAANGERHKKSAGGGQQRVSAKNSTLECCFEDLCNHDFEFDENLVIKDVLFGGGGKSVKGRRKIDNAKFDRATVEEAEKEDVVVLVDSMNMDPRTPGPVNSSRLFILLTVVGAIIALSCYYSYYFYCRSRRAKSSPSRFTTFYPILEPDNNGDRKKHFSHPPRLLRTEQETTSSHKKLPDDDYYNGGQVYDSVIASNLYWSSAKLDEKVDTFTVLMDSEDWRDRSQFTGSCNN